MPRVTPRTAALSTAAALGALLLTATAAQAHVQVRPDSTAAGSFAGLTFRVPNEDPTALTTKVEITLPSDHPLASVSVRPLAGWSVATSKAKLPKPVVDDGTTLTQAVHTVTWTAQPGVGIAAEEFQDFQINGGPLPEARTTLTFQATQTYSDGTVVNWNQVAQEGQDEPEHPAPSFEVSAATGADPDAAPPVYEGRSASAPLPATATGTTSSTDDTARWLGGAGLVVGVIGLLVGALGLRRRNPSPVAPVEREQTTASTRP